MWVRVLLGIFCTELYLFLFKKVLYIVKLDGLNLNLNFSCLKGTRADIMATCEIKFDVSHDLYKGFLLTDFQVVQTSKNRNKVDVIEKEMSKWLNQMKIIISRGHQLTQESNQSGPLKELEHWRSMLALFSHVSSFIDSKEFNNFYRCLKLSRSKIISVIKANKLV